MISINIYINTFYIPKKFIDDIYYLFWGFTELISAIYFGKELE